MGAADVVPIVPLDGTFDVPPKDSKIEGLKCNSLHCEIYVPHAARAGVHKGKLTLKAGEQTHNRIQMPKYGSGNSACDVTSRLYLRNHVAQVITKLQQVLPPLRNHSCDSND